MRQTNAVVLAIASLLFLGSAHAAESLQPAWITTQRIAQADREPQNWLSSGRDYSEQRFSPLKSIDAANVAQLGLA